MNWLTELLIRIPPVILLGYVPLVCYLDLRYREVEHGVWIPLAVVGLPVVAYLYLAGLYPWTLLVLSLVMCGFCYVAMRMGVWGGADFLFLCGINLCFIMDTIPIPQGIGLFPFYIYLVPAYLALLAPYVFRKDWDISKRPMMLAISAALVMAVVLH